MIVAAFINFGLNEHQVFFATDFLLRKRFIYENYINDLEKVCKKNFAFAILCKGIFPSLYKKLVRFKNSFKEVLMLDISIITTPLIISLFSYNLSNDILMKLWNLLIIFGEKILFRSILIAFEIIIG